MTKGRYQHKGRVLKKLSHKKRLRILTPFQRKVHRLRRKTIQRFKTTLSEYMANPAWMKWDRRDKHTMINWLRETIPKKSYVDLARYKKRWYKTGHPKRNSQKFPIDLGLSNKSNLIFPIPKKTSKP